ncbi:FAD binding domain-containing protein [Saccharopolyspora sp. K220]|uniref:FAD binding domain-containing protein n=1 Tax=Saccharopolyspora soli TaxID=2926618 RepID=UPI001F59AA92|nr:FAD binding domain-containing protein [Saccharopolyspora soli]MCI2422242.1 FAD binding domain-containing protein [Saccharopolyspora soli]
MKPAPVTLVRPRGVAECLAALDPADGSVVKVIAGGQSLMPMLALRMSTPDRLVDVGRVAELTAVVPGERVVELGARIRHRQLVDGAAGPAPAILGMAARHIGHDAIRNRGTLGGSLAHADPAAELPAVMVLLDAEIVCRSLAAGTRTIPARAFFLGPYLTAMRDDELLTAVRVPRADVGTRYGFVEFSPRHGDYARAGALCAVHTDPDGTVRRVGAVLFAVGSTPVDVSGALAAAEGHPLLACPWEDLATDAVASLPPPGEDGETAARRRLAAVALRRALQQASTLDGWVR